MKQEPPDYGYDTPEYNEMDYQNYYNTYPSQMDYQENSGGHNIKQDSLDDSYPFYGSGEMYGVHQTGPPSNGGGIGGGGGGGGGGPGLSVTPKKRGRPRKIRPEDGSGVSPAHSQSAMGYPLADTNGIRVVKERKKHDRFNGMTEEEVSQRTLPDHLAPNLDIVIVGINPGLFAAYKGHHYAGPGNHFWKCLYLSGLIPEPMTADDDYKLLNLGIGFTNIVERATKGSADLTRKEIKIGGQVLLEKLQKYRPKIAVFNGKYIYEVFSGKKDFNFGRQPEMVEGTNTYMWVMPSSSARCAQLPRAADKVPFYSALKKFRDYLKGSVHEINESELVFSNFKMKNFIEPEMKEEIQEGQCSYNYNFSMSEGGYRHDGENPPPKKKRGRPKKVKVDDDGKGSKDDKPGTPLKYKEERDEFPQSENSNLSNHCFSPPTQSPGMPSYMYQQHQHQQQQPHPQQQQPPPSSHYTPSPQHYNPSPQNSPLQSPRPFSQHSDLSSDLRAAISSDNQAPQQSASSTTSSAFSPYFGGGSGAASNSGGGVVGGSGVHDDASSSSSSQRLQQQQQQQQQQQDEAAKPYSSPQNKPSYQSYDPSGYDDGYSKKSMAQDVSSRSLSGLESLIDQMRNDTDEDSTFHGDNRTSHFHPSLSGGGGGQYGGGNADSPNINGSSIGGAGSGNTGGGAGASLNSYVNFTAPPHIQMNDQHYSGGGGGGGGGYTNDHQSSNSPHSPRFAPLQQQQAQGGSGGCGDSGSSSSSSTLTPYNYPYTSSGYFPPTSSPYFTNSQLYSNISS